MCRTGKGERLLRSSSHLSLRQWYSVCFRYFQFREFLAKLQRQIMFSLLTQRGDTNCYALTVCAGQHSFMLATCSTAMNWVWNYSEICTLKFIISPQWSLPEPLMPLDIHSGYGIKNSFEYSIFKKPFLYAVTDSIAQTIWLRITSEQEESPVTKIWKRNSFSIPATKKQALLFLAITPYLPNNWGLWIFLYIS